MGFILSWWAFSGGKPERVLQHTQEMPQETAESTTAPHRAQLWLDTAVTLYLSGRQAALKSLFETLTLLPNSASDRPSQFAQFAASLAFLSIIGHNHGRRPANDIDH